MKHLNTESELSEMTNTTQQSYTNSNAKENDSLSCFKREQIEKTPFETIYIPEMGYYLNWGIFRLSEAYQTRENVLTYLEDYKWQITAAMAGIIASQVVQDKNLQKEAEERMIENVK